MKTFIEWISEQKSYYVTSNKPMYQRIDDKIYYLKHVETHETELASISLWTLSGNFSGTVGTLRINYEFFDYVKGNNDQLTNDEIAEMGNALAILALSAAVPFNFNNDDEDEDVTKITKYLLTTDQIYETFVESGSTFYKGWESDAYQGPSPAKLQSPDPLLDIEADPRRIYDHIQQALYYHKQTYNGEHWPELAQALFKLYKERTFSGVLMADLLPIIKYMQQLKKPWEIGLKILEKHTDRKVKQFEKNEFEAGYILNQIASNGLLFFNVFEKKHKQHLYKMCDHYIKELISSANSFKQGWEQILQFRRSYPMLAPYLDKQIELNKEWIYIRMREEEGY